MSDDDIKNYVPLASSRAFHVHTLQVADRDPLGHLLIAYFQESTVAFFDDCVDFYRSVESAYGLPGFFEPWKAHMRLDLDECHSQALAQLFDQDVTVTPSEQKIALRNAWTAYRFLHCALDDILDQERDEDTLDLRPPNGLAGTAGGVPMSINAICLAAVSGRCEPKGADLSELAAHRSNLRQVALDGALATLSRCLDHDLILAIGHLCRALRRSLGSAAEAHVQARSIWVEAIGHQLAEQAFLPAGLCAVLLTLSARWRQSLGSELFDGESQFCLERISGGITFESRTASALLVESRHSVDFFDRALVAAPIDPNAYLP